MKKKLRHFYQKLSLIQKLLIPMILALLFGFILTIIIVKQVRLIDKNTILVKNELIPTLEMSTNNRALLKSISENLTFAILAEEEDMISDIGDNETIKINLKEIISNKKIDLVDIDIVLASYKMYFLVATTYAMESIEGKVSDDVISRDTKQVLFLYNEVERDFLNVKNQIKKEIAVKTNLIEKISTELIYFTVIYIIVFSLMLFSISYLIYKDFNKRFNNLSKSLNSFGIQKTSLENRDAMGILSENINRAKEDYTTIELQKKELSLINKNIKDSIEYASIIQQAILPTESILDSYTKDHCIYWQPRDTVGGDIYFIAELENKNELLVMIIDGVGHSVSGAFLTILVKAIETQIVAKINSKTLDASPAKILKYFNQTIKSMLKQEKGSKSNTGFDGGILYYNRITNECKYAGAKTPIYIVEENQLKIIKSDRTHVGFIRTKIDQEYTEHNIEIKKGTKLYITTDGIIDQEGKNNLRYGKKRFEELILDNHHKPFIQQRKIIIDSFIKFKEDCTQSDDITILGLEF